MWIDEVEIIHETEKAVFLCTDSYKEAWFPKSEISMRKIRLKGPKFRIQTFDPKHFEAYYEKVGEVGIPRWLLEEKGWEL